MKVCGRETDEGRERENEMGVKGNEIERNIFSTSPNPKRKRKKEKKNLRKMFTVCCER